MLREPLEDTGAVTHRTMRNSEELQSRPALPGAADDTTRDTRTAVTRTLQTANSRQRLLERLLNSVCGFFNTQKGYNRRLLRSLSPLSVLCDWPACPETRRGQERGGFPASPPAHLLDQPPNCSLGTRARFPVGGQGLATLCSGPPRHACSSVCSQCTPLSTLCSGSARLPRQGWLWGPSGSPGPPACPP